MPEKTHMTKKITLILVLLVVLAVVGWGIDALMHPKIAGGSAGSVRLSN